MSEDRATYYSGNAIHSNATFVQNEIEVCVECPNCETESNHVIETEGQSYIQCNNCSQKMIIGPPEI